MIKWKSVGKISNFGHLHSSSGCKDFLHCIFLIKVFNLFIIAIFLSEINIDIFQVNKLVIQ